MRILTISLILIKYDLKSKHNNCQNNNEPGKDEYQAPGEVGEPSIPTHLLLQSQQLLHMLLSQLLNHFSCFCMQTLFFILKSRLFFFCDFGSSRTFISQPINLLQMYFHLSFVLFFKVFCFGVEFCNQPILIILKKILLPLITLVFYLGGYVFHTRISISSQLLISSLPLNMEVFNRFWILNFITFINKR